MESAGKEEHNCASFGIDVYRKNILLLQSLFRAFVKQKPDNHPDKIPGFFLGGVKFNTPKNNENGTVWASLLKSVQSHAVHGSLHSQTCR